MKVFAYTLVFVGFLNFIIYVIVAVSIGGDAVNGKAEGGKYYLGEHGRFTEVTQSVYEYSRIHTYSVWVTHPLAMVAAYFLATGKKKKVELPNST